MKETQGASRTGFFSYSTRSSVKSWTVIGIFGLLAMVLGSISNFSCKTISISQFQQEEIGFRRAGSLDSGPFFYRSNQIIFLDIVAGNSSQYAFDICRPYSILEDFGREWDQDSLTTAIRVFASLAVTSGGVCLGVILMVPSCGVTTCLWNCCGILLLLTGIFQGLCLTITDSTLCLNNPILQILEDSSRTSALRNTFANSCQVSVGYNCGVAATILWLLSGLATLSVPAPSKWEDDWCSGATPIPATDQDLESKPIREEQIER